jgi:hypothetical protein
VSGSGNGGDGGFSGIRTCPRCGKPIWNVVTKRRGSKLYYYAVHRDILPDGRAKFTYCYLGPRYYTYVKKTHQDYDIDFKGAIEELEGFPRASSYLSELAVALKRQVQAGTLPARKALELANAIERLAGLAGELRQYAEVKAKEEQEQAKEEEDKEGEEQ